MPKKKNKKDYTPHREEDHAPGCCAPGCIAPGVYKAPVSKDRLSDYQWLCLDHIREYNRQYDFFSDMDRQQIEAFMRDALTGHRPTWRREHQGKLHENLEDALDEFLNTMKKKPPKTPKHLGQKLREALSVMDLDYPYTAQGLKAQYRQMVKKFHPDAHQGSKYYDDKFKGITAAYVYLTEHLKVGS